MGTFAVYFYFAGFLTLALALFVLLSFFVRTLFIYRKSAYDAARVFLLLAVIVFLFAIATKDPIDVGGIPFEVSGSTAIAIYFAWLGFSVKNLETRITELREDLKHMKMDWNANKENFKDTRWQR